MKRARHIKRGFKRFGYKGLLACLYEGVKRISSHRNIINMVMANNMVDNGDGTISFKRPHSYL